MRYFLDTEFLEGKQKINKLRYSFSFYKYLEVLLIITGMATIQYYSLDYYYILPIFAISLYINIKDNDTLSEAKPTIDLISIGIVSEDDREYYAVSKDFNIKEAWNRYQMKQVYGDMRNRYPDGVKEYWIRENVLKQIFFDLAFKDFHLTHFKDTWLSDDIDEARKLFMEHKVSNNYKFFVELIKKYGKTNSEIAKDIERFVYNPESVRPMGTEEPIHFYTYYGDYDWVVFCWLFGKMIDLPKYFPMYSRDLKQMQDYYEYRMNLNNLIPTAHYKIKSEKEYPTQENEHNALDDAKWNKRLYDFLEKGIENKF